MLQNRGCRARAKADLHSVFMTDRWKIMKGRRGEEEVRMKKERSCSVDDSGTNCCGESGVTCSTRTWLRLGHQID